MNDEIRVLHVEDDQDIVTIVRLSLDLDGRFDIRVAHTEEDAGEALADRSWPADVVLLDLHLGASSGLDLLKRLRVERPSLPVLLMTASVTSDQIARYHSLGASGVISKPFDPLSLAAQIRQKLQDAVEQDQ